MSEPNGEEGNMHSGGGFTPGGDLDDDSLGSDDWFLPADPPIQQPLPSPGLPSVSPVPSVQVPPAPPVQDIPVLPAKEALQEKALPDPSLFQVSPVQEPPVPQQPLPSPGLPSVPPVIPVPQAEIRPVETVAPLVAPAVPAFFYCRKGSASKRLHEFETERALLGRSSSCDLIVEDRFAGRRHAELFYQEGVWKLLDLSSANGTTVNSRRVGRDTPNPVVLGDGDVVVIGDTEFVFKQIV